MNNKGLTIVELVVSFALSVVVAVFLIQIILLLKDMYISTGARSVIMNKQAILTDRMNQIFENRRVVRAEKCGDTCIRLHLDDNVDEIIAVDTKAKTISVGDYTSKLPDSVEFGTIVMKTTTIESQTDHFNSILQIQIPIKDKIVTMQTFDINVIYQYDKRKENWSI